METFLTVLAMLLLVAGLVGCIMPAVPGPPLSYLALWLLQWSFKPFTGTFLITWGIVVAIVLVLDYMIPIWTAKRFGATREGIIGSIIGMLLGILLTPVGMLLGLIIGAIAGDMYAGRTSTQAARSGLATFFGTLLTIGIKLFVSGLITLFSILVIIRHFME